MAFFVGYLSFIPNGLSILDRHIHVEFFISLFTFLSSFHTIFIIAKLCTVFVGKWLDHVGHGGKRHFCIVVETKKKGVLTSLIFFCYSYNHF